MFDFGAIVVARLPQTDGRPGKLRPALVVSRGGAGPDVILCRITHVRRTGPHDAALPDSPGTGLLKSSVVRFDKLATVEAATVKGRIGAAPAEWLEAHRATFFGVFGFGAPPSP